MQSQLYAYTSRTYRQLLCRPVVSVFRSYSGSVPSSASTENKDELVDNKETSSEKQPGHAPRRLRKVFVGNIPPNIGQMEMIRLFSDVGRVNNFWFSRASTRYGLCMFEDPEKVKEAIDKFNGFEFRGSKLIVEEPRKKTQD